MLKVYRGWIFNEKTEGILEAKKGEETITGEFEDIVPKIDKIEYEEVRKSEQVH